MGLVSALMLLFAAGALWAGAAEDPYRGIILKMTGDESSPVLVWAPNGKQVLDPYYALEQQGLALIGRDYALRLEGGQFYTGGAEEYLGGDLKQAAGELTLAAYIDPGFLAAQKSGCIIGYGPPKGHSLFALRQEKNALTFSANTGGPQRVNVAQLNSAAPFHLVLTVAKQEIAVYINGRKTGTYPGIKGDFSAWPDGMLFFGNDGLGRQPWWGRLELAALYNKALNPDEAQAAAHEALEIIKDREAVPRLEIEGTLLARSEFPKPWDPGFTYRLVLAICEYEVDKVIRGDYPEQKMRVAEWMYVDRIFLTNSQKKIGTKHRLVVELLNDNPQLRDIERANSLDYRDGDDYYALTPLEALAEDEQPRELKQAK